MNQQLSTQVEIKVSCRKLKDEDVFSESDPFLVIQLKDRTGQWNKIGETEVQKNQLNPNFKEKFKTEFFFEEKQEVQFQVFDFDSNGNHDLLGQCFTTLGTIVGSRNNIYTTNLLDSDNKQAGKSTIIITADSFRECKDEVFMEWAGAKLADTDFFSKSDPFLRFQRLRSDGQTYSLAYETEVIDNCLNPNWKGKNYEISKLCNGDIFRYIKIECWDDENDDGHQFIGSALVTIDEIVKGKREFELENPKIKKAGKLVLKNFVYISKPTFLQFISGNCQLNLFVSVDFTASNGEPTNHDSLHHIDPSQMNAYQQAIYTIGGILLDYDFDKKVPCFGFGGVPRYPQLTQPIVQHCFPMTGNPHQVEVVGLQQIMGAYANSLQHVSLSGPTYFTPIINEAIRVATISKQNGSQVYTIQLILTDGEIHDMDTTINSIVNASELPLSIIIVGVGSANFDNMKALDGDKGNLTNSQGKSPVRDLVQFVEYKNFGNNVAELAKQVLAEVPHQLVQYMAFSGINPTPRLPVNLNNH